MTGDLHIADKLPRRRPSGDKSSAGLALRDHPRIVLARPVNPDMVEVGSFGHSLDNGGVWALRKHSVSGVVHAAVNINRGVLHWHNVSPVKKWHEANREIVGPASSELMRRALEPPRATVVPGRGSSRTPIFV
jgi:hypothetical protein